MGLDVILLRPEIESCLLADRGAAQESEELVLRVALPQVWPLVPITSSKALWFASSASDSMSGTS
jgi:hypothetical protein